MTTLDKEIELCVKHVTSTDNQYTIIGDFIAKCLLVRMCSKYEIAICEMVRIKLDTITDENFCTKMNRTLERFSLLPDQLEEKILKKFGDTHVKKFSKQISDIRIKYGNMIKNRHSVAHGRDIEFTINEILGAHTDGKTVMYAFKTALEIDNT